MVRTWPAARLTADETGELDLALSHLRALVVTARVLVTASGHDPDLGECTDASCRLAAVEEGPRLCALAQRLALLDLAHLPTPDDPPTRVGAGRDHGAGGAVCGLEEALAAFRRALVMSLDAVRTCRSVGHAEGRCWFTPSAGIDGCGDVLRAAHRAG